MLAAVGQALEQARRIELRAARALAHRDRHLAGGCFGDHRVEAQRTIFGGGCRHDHGARAACFERGRPGPGAHLGILLGVDLGGRDDDAREREAGIQVGAQHRGLLATADRQREAGAVGLAEHREGIAGAAAALRDRFIELAELRAGAGLQAVAVGEQRRVVLVAHVERRLAGRLRPRERQRAAEVIALAACEQHVRHALAFGAWQPGRDEGVRQIQEVVAIHRPARDHHRDDGFALAGHRLQYRQVFRIAAAVAQRAGWVDVAIALRIRALADDGDDGVELRQVDALGIDAEADVVAAGCFADAGQDRVGILEVRIGRGRALPRDRPAAALVRHLVGALADDQDFLAAFQRQGRAFVLEQHERLAHRLARQRARLHRVVLAGVRILGRALVEQAGAQLDADDAGDGVVDPRHRDFSRFDLLDRVGDEGFPVVRHHDHVIAGVDRLGAAVVAAAFDLADAVPVGDDEAIEAHLALEDVGQRHFAAMELAVFDAGGGIGPAVK